MSNKENAKKDFEELKNGFRQLFKDIKNPKTFYKQIPNLLTLSRLVMALFIPVLALSSNLISATILTVMAAATDALDGFAARKLNAQSEFGRNLDPICDKLFVGLLVVPLLFNLSPIVTLGLSISLALEGCIAGINLYSRVKGNVPKTTLVGKAKTALLSALLASLYISFSYQSIISIVPMLYACTTTSQLMACVSYYEIDRKKDLEKKRAVLTNSKVLDKDFIEKDQKTLEKEVSKDKQESIQSTIEDLINLKEEILNTKDSNIEQKGFQKILK